MLRTSTSTSTAHAFAHHTLPSLLARSRCRYAPYRGYQAGDRINDHDIALAFVLETFGQELPSYKSVPTNQQRVICFTQAEIGFNHGWLVQVRSYSPRTHTHTLSSSHPSHIPSSLSPHTSHHLSLSLSLHSTFSPHHTPPLLALAPSLQAEAPPHALFSKFKEVIARDGASTQDVAFYFVHWLTDLAGAEPVPLHGSEKFVCKVLLAVTRTTASIHHHHLPPLSQPPTTTTSLPSTPTVPALCARELHCLLPGHPQAGGTDRCVFVQQQQQASRLCVAGSKAGSTA